MGIVSAPTLPIPEQTPDIADILSKLHIHDPPAGINAWVLDISPP